MVSTHCRGGGTCEEEASEVLHLEHSVVWC
jgi:hypothetical protein